MSIQKNSLILHKPNKIYIFLYSGTVHCLKTNEVFLGVHRLVPHRGSYRSPVKKIKMDY